jgi:oxaloacetate decarboxylase beta subunit
MEKIDLPSLFQGIGTLLNSGITLFLARTGLMALGLFLIYLGKKKILEPLLMIPMGLGMATINASVMILPGGRQGNLFVDPLLTDPADLINILQIDWLQPIYTFTFSNGLIACCIFMGIGVLLDVGYILRRPFLSIFLALFAELGTFAVVPIASAMGMNLRDSASIAMVGGADGPMVLFTSMVLSKELFVPITIVAYLYLGFTYGGYPYLIKLLVPKHIRGIQPPKPKNTSQISSSRKLLFAVVLCVILCLLFPVAAPLFFSLFLGIAVREADIQPVVDFIKGPLLYGSTFFLGLLLGILCEAHLILNPAVLPLLLLGILALFLSGIGGLLGGYIIYWFSGKKFNPVIGIAGVSCVPSTAKVAQKAVSEVNPRAIILQDALGANISGVITTAIIAGLYVTLIPLLG